MQTLVIGDIHGCTEELEDLLEKAGIGAGDRVVAVGDVVDRGPDTPGVISRFRTTPRWTSVRGNHERKHLLAAEGQVEPARSQLISRRQLGEVAYVDALAWMRSLPLSLDLSAALVVHGMWEPGVPLQAQRETVLCGVISGELHLKRRLAHPWWQLYDGDQPLIVGHHAYNGTQPLVWRDRVWGLDTGCCQGGRLTGLLLPAFRIISVPARVDHWSRLREIHSDLYPPQDHGSAAPDPLAEIEAAAASDQRPTWTTIDRHLRSVSERTAQLSPQATAWLEGCVEACRAAEPLLPELMRRLEQRSEAVLNELRRTIDYDQLSRADKYHRFAARLGNEPLARALHLARTKKLTSKELKRCVSPWQVIEASVEPCSSS